MLYLIQNDEEVPPGSLTENLPVPFEVIRPYRDGRIPAPAGGDALVILGGAMGANDEQRHPFLGEVKQLIRHAVTGRVPLLGICLGGQLLAAALGARVVSDRWQEIGMLPVSLSDEGKRDRLFAGVSERFTTFQWHHDSFDLPEAGVLLASSGRCPHQAFRIGESAWGVQFHPEVTEEIVRNWCVSASYPPDKIAGILEQFRRSADQYSRIARTLVENFIAAAP